MKEGQPPVNIESFGGQHTDKLHHVPNEIITGDDPFHNHKLIYLDLCLDLELIKSDTKQETINGDHQYYHYQCHDD